MKRKVDPGATELELAQEAMRRATWNALHGPRRLRSGRYPPDADPAKPPRAAE